MSATWTIARLTVREAARRKLVLALLLVTLVTVAFTSWAFAEIPNMHPHNRPGPPPQEVLVISSQLLILVMFMFSFVLALAAVFMAAPTIAGELESGVALAILTRPISRGQYLFGKWLGLALLLLAYVSGSSLLEFQLVRLGTGYYPPHPFLFIAYMLLETLVILTLTVLISTRMSPMAGGIVALGAYGAAFIGGIVEHIGLAFKSETVTNIGAAVGLVVPSDGVWHGAIYSLEPAVALALAEGVNNQGFAASNPFFSGSAPSPAFMAWVFAWMVGVLLLARFSFGRREV
ncbi:MAG: ABC transporter permease subunit [Candidatus Dormibacteria bacterium]